MRILASFLFFLSILSSTNLSNKQIINYGIYLDGVILSGEKEVRVAINLWLSEFIKLNNKSENVYLYKDIDKLLEEFIENKYLNIICFDSITYLKNQDLLKNLYKDLFTFINKKDDYLQYYLLSNSSNSIYDIRNSSISLKKGDNSAQMWFDYLIYNRLNEKKYYSEVIKSEIFIQKQSQGILNTFFGKTDFTVVPKNVWEIATKINPKIKRQLSIIAKSPKIFTPSVCLIGKNTSDDIIKKFKNSIIKINSSTDGREILDLLKINKILLIDESYFDELHKFYKNYLSLGRTIDEN